MTAPTTEPPALEGEVWRRVSPEGEWWAVRVLDGSPLPYRITSGGGWGVVSGACEVYILRAWALHERARADAERAARKAESYALALLLVPEADTKTCAEAALCARMTADVLRALGVEP